jgi:hypothetical protein
MPATGAALDPCPVNVRNKISALWASTLFVFAYVDLFSFYRSDFRADVEPVTSPGSPSTSHSFSGPLGMWSSPA